MLILLLLFSLEAQSQTTAITDSNFEKFLIEKGYDTGNPDGYVLTNKINGIKSLNVAYKGIRSLEGIEDFTALESLSCNGNQLKSLDLRANVSMKYLSCSDNLLTNLDIKQNTNLVLLFCSRNLLSEISIKNNNNLEVLIFSANNQLKYVDLRNGNNPKLTSYIYGGMNPSLKCVLVDDVNYSNNNWKHRFGKDVKFINDYSQCDYDYKAEKTHIQDKNFEQALIDKGYDTGTPNGYVYTHKIENISKLDVSDREIKNLKGIESFVMLKELMCNKNNLTTLDLKKNVKLEKLLCQENKLTKLAVHHNLKHLQCYKNKLSKLDFDIHKSHLDSDLEYIDCHSNKIKSIESRDWNSFIDSNGIKSLKWLNIKNNKLVTLNLSKSHILKQLYCDNNDMLKDIDLKNGNNKNLSVSARYNPSLKCVIVDDASYSSTYWKNYFDPNVRFINEVTDCTNKPLDNQFALKYDFTVDGPINGYVSLRSTYPDKIIIKRIDVFKGWYGRKIYSFGKQDNYRFYLPGGFHYRITITTNNNVYSTGIYLKPEL